MRYLKKRYWRLMLRESRWALHVWLQDLLTAESAFAHVRAVHHFFDKESNKELTNG